MDLIVVSFATDRRYKDYMERLRRSCFDVQIDHLLVNRPCAGSWVANCAQKGPFLLEMFHSLKRPMLWVDADGVIVRYPDLLYAPDCDFAIRAEPGSDTRRAIGRRETFRLPESWPQATGNRWFNTGTMYFNYTEGALGLLESWADTCQENPRAYQQHLLQEVWSETQVYSLVANNLSGPKTLWLPQGYNKIRRMRWKPGEDQTEVIVHDLASTTFKAKRT